MDLLYQQDTSFYDMGPRHNFLIMNPSNTFHNKSVNKDVTKTPSTKDTFVDTKHVSPLCHDNPQQPDVTVALNANHMTHLNANDVTDITHIIDQVITQQGTRQSL